MSQHNVYIMSTIYQNRSHIYVAYIRHSVTGGGTLSLGVMGQRCPFFRLTVEGSMDVSKFDIGISTILHPKFMWQVSYRKSTMSTILHRSSNSIYIYIFFFFFSAASYWLLGHGQPTRARPTCKVGRETTTRMAREDERVNGGSWA